MAFLKLREVVRGEVRLSERVAQLKRASTSGPRRAERFSTDNGIYIPFSVVSGSSPSLPVTFYQYTIYLEMCEMLSHSV